MAITVTSPANRYRRGPYTSTKILYPPSTQINPGDLIWDNGGVAAIFSAFSWTTNLADTQPLVKAAFLGVAMDQMNIWDAATTRYGLVMTSGIFYYPCAALSQAYDIGTFVNADKDPGGNNLATQVLATVSGVTLGIGKLVEYANSGATGLMVYLSSTLAVYPAT